MIEFTPSSCYSLDDYTVVFTSDAMEIRNRTTMGLIVSLNYSDGVAIKANGDDLCIGTGKFKQANVARFDLNAANFGLELVIHDNACYVFGSATVGDPYTTKQSFNITKGAIRLISKDDILLIQA